MPADKRPITFRASFDQAAEDYDAVRPGYPPGLINDIVTIAALPTNAHILEIGCGTGQATMPFAQHGYQLTCLDIGVALLAIAQRKFTSFPNVRFHLVAFEDWPAQPDMFDLVMSATAFHWIAPEVGYPKAAYVLKDTGSLAIFSNEHLPFTSGFAADLYQVEQRLVPEWSEPYADHNLDAAIAETAATINATNLFEPVIIRKYPWSQVYTTMEYIRLLNTYSNYRNLERQSRTQLFRAIADLIDRKHDGTITKSYLAVLYLAQKRSSS
jgi:ubiquinone/menaquinone biosynthesis C-methylase UbiE